MRRRDHADLARDQLQPTAARRAAQRHRHPGPAVPAQLDDGRFVAARPAPSRGRRRWRWHGRPASHSVGASLGWREPRPSAAAMAARAGLMSTSVTSAAASFSQKSGQCADHARANDGDPAEGTGPASHTAFSAVSMLAARTARRRHARAAGDCGAPGRSNSVWCGCSAKTARPRDPAARSRRADGRVAVFHRKREGARHEWRAHALEFRGGTRPWAPAIRCHG